MTTVAFVLASWVPDAPAGMERATAALAAALAHAGQRAVIITAAVDQATAYGTTTVVPLTGLPLQLPCDDDTLHRAADRHAAAIQDELVHLYSRHGVDVAVYVDALWGLGFIAPISEPARRVLAAHVVGHDTDLHAALARQPDAVIAPSSTVVAQAAARGIRSDRWHVVPNTLLVEHPPTAPPRRAGLRRTGPVRVLARLSAVKGPDALLDTVPADWDRPVDVALAEAGFEDAVGEQRRVLDRCRAAAASTPAVRLRPGLPWAAVPRWLADAAVVIVPSRRESFGLVALEAMAVGTPVVAYAVDNLPDLVGAGGVLAPASAAPVELWRAAADLLADPVRYEATSRAAYYRSRDYRPALAADQLLKVVS